MRIHRSSPEERFTIIPNETLRDERLSYRARGILAEILSRPDYWSTNADTLAAQARNTRGKTGEGRLIVRAAFTELQAAGYLRRERTRGPRGRFATELHFYDVSINQNVSADGTDDRPTGRRSTSTPVTSTPVTSTPATGAPAGRTSPRRPATKTSHENDLKSSDSPWDDPAVVAAAAAGLRRETGREISAELAAAAVRAICEGRQVRRPVPYVGRAIRENAARYLPAAAPQPYKGTPGPQKLTREQIGAIFDKESRHA
jgi:hypothetical protein